MDIANAESGLALEPFPVESDIPVRKAINKMKQAGEDCV
jgi:hypothetical protein